MHSYNEYTNLTLSGAHGSTAQFWMLYVKLVHLYLMLIRACKIPSLELFTYILGEMRYVFFACNRQNYARWMVRYYLNLVNIDKTHPGMRQVLENGALSIRRTNKPFSRTPVDMTLEQTVNADAASRQTGIAAFGTKDGARRRWMVTRSARSAIIGALLIKAGLKSLEDTSKELKPYRMQKDNDDLKKLQESIKSRMNPFEIEPEGNLYCLTNGKKVSDDINDDLLQCIKKGTEWCTEFTAGCFSDPGRFEKPIPRRKIKNFTSAAVKTTVKKDLKLIELQGTRDLFGRLLCISTQHNIELDKVFAYPLTVVPLSLAHVDGSINRTDKAKLLHKIENMVDVSNLNATVDVTIVDAMFLLHTLLNLPNTYGEIAKTLMAKLCEMSKRVDLVFDMYVTPSVKDSEHERRLADDVTYTITGPGQRRPKDWQKALRSASFKTALFHFLLDEWTQHVDKEVLDEHEIYIGIDNECYRLAVNGQQILCDKIPALSQSYHEEADTRIMFHLSSVLSTQQTVAVRSSDTDVFILLLYHVSHHQDCTSKVWMDAGLSTNNSRRYISISTLVSHLDQSVIDALPALHAFTGSDYTSSFMNKGKIRAFQIMMNEKSFTNAFATLGNSGDISDLTAKEIERFTCTLYGMSKLNSINDVRYALFQQKYAPKRNKTPLEKIQGINPSSMPPCHAVLRNKLLRTNYVASLWKNANKPKPVTLNAEQHGWVVENGKYSINWFQCSQLPPSIVNIISEENVQLVNSDEEPLMDEAANYSSDEFDSDDDDECD